VREFGRNRHIIRRGMQLAVTMRIMKLSRLVLRAWMVVVLATACGSSHDDGTAHVHPGPDSAKQDGGHSMHAEDAASEDAAAGASEPEPIPTKHGIPIGDCKDPTAQSLAAQGCPAMQPQPMQACSADQDGKECRYEIRIESTLTSQLVFTCNASEGNWGPGSTEFCGETCGTSDEHAIEFDTKSCTERTAAVCDDGKGTQYAFTPSAYTLAGAMLQSVLEACKADMASNLVEMAFVNGCPARMTSHIELDATAVACLKQRLAPARWKCATTLPCINRSWSFLND
jgi:hypothetical protein